MPTDVNLDFASAITGTIKDKDGLGTGFTSVQRNTANNAYDLGHIDLNPSASTLVLTATQGSHRGSANTLKNALQVPISASTQPFTISTRLKGPFTNLNTHGQQAGVFPGSSQDNYVKLVLINTSSGLGLQFNQEQKGVGSNVGGGSGAQVTGLDWASIDTLDLFLKGNPATGVVTAAYRVNSDTATPTTLTQEFKPSSTAPFFRNSTSAGILAFTVTAPEVPVTFDNFGIQYSPNIKINFQPDTSAVPAGYIKDIGEGYSATRGFGWVREDSLSNATATPLSIVPNGRDRNRVGIDQQLDTLLHMQFPTTASNSTAVKIPAAWEYALPNGTYSVRVSVGDQPGYDSQHTINVEGVNAISRFRGTSTQEYKQATVQVNVTDGKLTVDAIGGINTKINFIEVSRATPGFTKINWNTAEPSPVGRTEPQTAMVDGKLYTFGGFVDNPSFGPTNRSDVYNPVTNTWTQLPNMPKRLTHTGTEVDGKDIYIAGGYVGSSSTNFGAQIFATKDVWKYNVDTKTWAAMPQLPEARASGGLALLGRELHFFGGADINRKDKGDHWVLSLDGPTSWTSAAPLPNPRTHFGDAVLGGKIYAIGGQHSYDDNLVTQNSVHVWEPGNPKNWTEVASLPKALSHIGRSTFVMDNRIIVAGGETDHLKPVSDVVAYNPLSNSWTALTPLPVPRYAGAAGNIGNQIVFTMGSGRSRTTYKGTPA